MGTKNIIITPKIKDSHIKIIQITGGVILRKSILLTVILCFSLCITGIASAGEKKALETTEDAIERAQELFPEVIKGKEKELNVNFRENSQEEKDYWSIRWHSHMPGKDYAHFHLKMDSETGTLYNLRFDVPDKEKTRKQVLTRSEAKKKALAFARKYHPEKLAKLKLDNTHRLNRHGDELDLTYNFRWVRKINGVFYEENEIRVRVDALTGKVIYFNCNWSKLLNIQEVGIEKNELTDKIIKNLGFYPCYDIEKKPGSRENKAVLEYHLNTNQHQFSAKNGKPVDHQGNELSWDETKSYDSKFNIIPTPEKKVTPEKPVKNINRSEAEKIASEFFDKIGLEGKIDSSGGSTRRESSGFEEKYWEYRLKPGTKQEGHHHIEVRINARTGKINRYYNRVHTMPGNETEKAKISKKEASKKVEEFLDIVRPEGLENMVMRKEYDHPNDHDYDFFWAGLVNGIPFEDNYLRVSVNKQTGKVENFYTRNYQVKSFASTKDIITESKAAEAFKKNKPLKLDNDRVYNQQKQVDKTILIYRLNHTPINARTGEVKDSQKKKESIEPYKEKIQSHWAKLPLTLFAENGLLPEPEKFDTNTAVTRIEGLRTLAAACDRHYHPDVTDSPFSDVKKDGENFGTILNAVNNGIVEKGGKLNPDNALTREDLAIWVVNALDFDKVASSSIEIKLPYKDSSAISKDKKNYVAIADGLDIINPNKNGNFRPQDKVTWGELASVVIEVAPELRD
ncbi:MAG: S-layer homology domain-containing protein [Clostridiales bacterium]|nr:S-layer homology domain-containing protein [Clostridiales bacterium]MCF8021230.1 S-layer homology domain-containing protein [Clostridiales bacterium]